MNLFLRRNIALAGCLLPLRLIRSGKVYPPFLPFYHTVSDISPEYIDSYKVRTRKCFEKELDYLLRNFKPVDLKTCIEKPTKYQFHLSFDDGLRECYSVIAPVLLQKGIPATFFVCPGFIGNQHLFHRFRQTLLAQRGYTMSDEKAGFNQADELARIAAVNNFSFDQYLAESRPYMTLEELHSLRDDGFLIGSHSLNHPEFFLLSEEEQYRQIDESIGWVNRHFSPALRVFSFPFTDSGVPFSLFERLLKNNIVDATFGTAGLKYDQAVNHYQRVPMERKENWGAQKIVHFEYFYYFVRSQAGKNRVTRKS